MKKIIIIAGLLYAAQSGAMAGRVLLTAAASVLVPGLYYANRSYVDQDNIRKKFKDASTKEQTIERDVALANAQAKLTDYIDGVAWGMGFPINVVLLSGEAKKLSMPVVVDINQMKAEQAAGFFGGLSAYGTSLGLLSVIRKLKK